MNLYEMLDCTVYYQKVAIYETNTYDQNMPIFRGIVNDARKDIDDVWYHLADKVDLYEYINGTLLIKVANDDYNKRMEEHYLYSDTWGKDKDKRPWRHSIEIERELEEK